MPSYTFASCCWRALGNEGDDKCRLARTDDGWMLIGHARFRDEDGFAALDYVVRCDAQWDTLIADVAGDHEGRTIKIHIVRQGDVWLCNDVPQPEVSGARDIDLSFTPATNLMPLWKLSSLDAQEIAVCAAWLRYPEVTLQRLDQSYQRTRFSSRFRYSATQTGYKADLSVHNSGFVTLYPGLWEGEVTHAAP
ncbi:MULTISPECIES: putative glycolipid-binding domain-containing protein [unclassified Roseovarius]|uniref:putative glycolipid-binding domain-containing protein n=1 Tax=unclassified Roseovarius TaxID=2614913 RepID=UPI00273D5A90|nr:MULTISPECIES: putative glycolipid-binding domain-containing protein [unclassified Roseovarius]